jgi:predicted nucleotidyltransferase
LLELYRGLFVKHCNFFSAIAIYFRIILYLSAQKRAKLGGVSTIGASSVAFGLHELCAIIQIATLMSTQMMNQKIADYFKTQPVVKAWLFGSFARGEETPLSDVDLLVQYDEDGISLLKHAAMICELEKILDRPVDIVEDGTLRPRVRESVNQDRKLIYERER